MPHTYRNIILFSVPDMANQLADELTAMGALAITIENAAEEDLFQLQPGQEPLWEKIKITALFGLENSVKPIIQRIEQQLGLPASSLVYKVEILADQDWVKQTQRNFSAQKYGNNLCICPKWENIDKYSGRIVRIDPGLAFGTGKHPTTSLCLYWLAEHPPINQTVIDYGCGSGILALSALALGAERVWAVDHDPQAIEATANNARLNTFASRDQLLILLPQQLHLVQADIVIANILAKPLIEMAANLMQHVSHDGLLILSGILVSEIEIVANAYQPEMIVVEQTAQDEWARIVLSRRLPGKIEKVK